MVVVCKCPAVPAACVVESIFYFNPRYDIVSGQIINIIRRISVEVTKLTCISAKRTCCPFYATPEFIWKVLQWLIIINDFSWFVLWMAVICTLCEHTQIWYWIVQSDKIWKLPFGRDFELHCLMKWMPFPQRHKYLCASAQKLRKFPNILEKSWPSFVLKFPALHISCN